MKRGLWGGLAAALLGGSVGAASLEHIHSYHWNEDFEEFGGFSGLWVGEAGEEFVTVSDRGSFVRGTLVREGGLITGVAIAERGAIHGPKDPLPAVFMRDAEGLAVAKDGSLYVSFEGYHRVSGFGASMTNEPERTHAWDFFMHLQQNSGMEALAIDDDGALYAIPERSGAWTRPFPVYRYRDGVWDDTLKLPRSEKYLVAGADFGPDGKLYLLERLFEWYGGFSTRVRRFTLGGDGFNEGETILKSGFSQYGNLEGISLWRNAAGETIATLISDDNFNDLLRTSLVEFRLVE